MRLLKIILVVILVVVTALYCVTAVAQKLNTHKEGPSITCGEEVLGISVQDSETVLLSGLTASDAQDGDLTDALQISGISKFTDPENATANVTYLVFDSDGNVASCTRTVRYEDYVPPRFTLTDGLNYKSNDAIALLDRLHANDCIDGDITDSIRVSSPKSTSAGEIYTLNVQVTNSMGDTSELELEVVRQIDNSSRPQVVLSSYLIYLEQGSSFEPMSYVSHINSGNATISKTLATVSGSVNTDKPGTYHIHYSYNDGNATGVSILTVVVE